MCCLGHSSANSSIAIPGIGEPNYDTSGYRTNPNQDKKQQRKSDVRSWLDKLDPNTITNDALICQVGGFKPSDPYCWLENIHELHDEANEAALNGSNTKRKRKKGNDVVWPKHKVKYVQRMYEQNF